MTPTLYDIHNPTVTPRIIHDGIEGSQRPIKIMPGETVWNVPLGRGTVEMLKSRGDDLIVRSSDDEHPDEAIILAEGNLSLPTEFESDEKVPPVDYPLFIEIPAWSPYYVDLATRYTVPAVLASLEGSGYDDVTFFVHTDDRPAFEAALPGRKIKFFDMKIAPKPNAPQQDPLAKMHWAQFMEAHREAIVATPIGGLLVLLNSDIVPSIETFKSVNHIFADPKVKVGTSVGVRTLIDGASPPIGVDFDTLARWAWDNRHEITKQSVWDKGRINHTSHLFFEQDGCVAMHCFHLTPMFIRKDRNLSFAGTIDDDVMQAYGDDEIYYMNNHEAFFAELSPRWKKHSCGPTLTVNSVVTFSKRKMSKAHVRNFSRCFPVIGTAFAHPAAVQIFNSLVAVTPAQPAARRPFSPRAFRR